jgi:glycosyltransferase involved in cell wall biosynthesis
MGQLSNATVASIMAKAMIVVVPSRYEDPFPRVAQEALACGAVVVSSGRGGLPEATGDAALIADPDDTKALSVAIVTAASDEGLRSDLVERGRRHAQQFAIQAVVRHWQDLRESLLSPERCRRHPAQRPGR